MSDRWHRDRIVGAVFIAIGTIGLLGTLALGWAAGPRTADQVRVGGPPAGDQDGTWNGTDRLPDWMGQMRDRMQRGPSDDGMPGFGPGFRDPGGWGDGQGPGDGWLNPEPGGPGWHRGPGSGTPDASPSPSPSESPSSSTSPTPQG